MTVLFALLFASCLLGGAPAQRFSQSALDKSSRIVELRGNVDETLANFMLQQLTDFDRQSKRQTIYVVIDSTGGNTDDGARIIAGMLATKAPIVCVVDKEADSMAAWVFETACPYRVMQTNAELMFHRPNLGLSTMTAEEALAWMQHLYKQSTEMEVPVTARLHLSLEDYRKKVAHGWWLTGTEALAAGATDELVDGLKYHSLYPAAVPSPILP